ncbi:CIC11C00000000877 [Sungouiella intermedia]|uniref:protein-tyrosine-phosphatase n=1 Tax=Sungouiella intermedia TaxID=45354 RepID=A0A1L0BB05_9ASCO|nr:CIC11C00000000877 [[Candida] intermedia]
MMNSEIPTILANGLPLCSQGPEADRRLSLDTSIPKLPSIRLPVKSPQVLSPTSKYHFKDLPEYVTAVNASDSATVASWVDSNDVLIVDIRPFNFYSNSRLRNAYNVCVPTTLLKRASYDLQQVFNSTSLPAQLKEKVIAHSTPMKVLIYDDSSCEDHVMFSMYQMVQKFLKYDCFDVAYLSGGLLLVDSLLVDASTALPLRSPVSPVTPNSAKASNAEFASSNHGMTSSDTSKDTLPLLSGFTLPSATASNQKFIMSMKKDLPKLDTNVKYNYNFHLPEKFAEKKDKLPKWLSFFAENCDEEDYSKKIVEKLSEKFNKIEQTEQVRLNMAISNFDENNKRSPHYHSCSPKSESVTPLAMCPCCDPIDYNIPKGIENGYKNRYKNIWPYEHSRVRLISSPSCAPKKSSDDYFNANYIDFDKLSLTKYIATQDPLEATYEDFWNTVWYNGVKGIVCLTIPLLLAPQTYYEGNQFYSKSNLNIEIGDPQQFNGYSMREITMKKKETTRKVFHFAYSEWPDFGTPDNLSSIFEMLNKKNEKVETLSGQRPPTSKVPKPWELLVHCSAGCGRTGCFITIDMALDCFLAEDRLNRYDPWGYDDLVYKSVQFQRQQRVSMVQNLDQFVFCYEAIMNYVVEHLL